MRRELQEGVVGSLRDPHVGVQDDEVGGACVTNANIPENVDGIVAVKVGAVG